MISIIIRNKDESDFIGHAIQSCVDNFKDPEIIIVDDNSQDDSDRVISLFDNTILEFIPYLKNIPQDIL